MAYYTQKDHQETAEIEGVHLRDASGKALPDEVFFVLRGTIKVMAEKDGERPEWIVNCAAPR